MYICFLGISGAVYFILIVISSLSIISWLLFFRWWTTPITLFIFSLILFLSHLIFCQKTKHWINDDEWWWFSFSLYAVVRLAICYSRMMAAPFCCFFQFSLHALGDSFSLTYNALSPKVCFATRFRFWWTIMKLACLVEGLIYKLLDLHFNRNLTKYRYPIWELIFAFWKGKYFPFLPYK